MKNKGFTLIEILIVVVIIGVLTAIALPAYRKAVEKSRVAGALNTIQAVVKSEHGWYLMNNSYTTDFSDLDIDLIDDEGKKADGATYDTVNYTFTLQDNSIKAESNNDEYTLYKLYEDGNIYCLPTNHYICQQFEWGMNGKSCGGLGNFWSDKETTCYESQQDRCTGEGMPWAEGIYDYRYPYAFCGYFNADGVKIEGYGSCKTAGDDQCLKSTFTGPGASCSSYRAGNRGCQWSQFNDGAVCNSTGSYACRNSEFNNKSICYSIGAYACNASTYTAGSKCIVNNNNGGYVASACSGSVFKTNSECVSGNTLGNWGLYFGGCEGNTFKEGSKCIANAQNSCRSNTFEAGSCCESENNYCPKGTPRCECGLGENGRYPTSCAAITGG